MIFLPVALKKVSSLWITILFLSAPYIAKGSVVVWPLPPGEAQSTDYQVEADGKTAFVSTAQVLHGAPASFSSFDFSGSVQVKITTAQPISSFKILPSNLGIQATVVDNQLIFNLTEQVNLTIEVNDSMENALHLFAGNIETNVPNPKDPNVIYFGPGVHEVSTLHPKTGQIIYLAPGCILRAVIPPDEEARETNIRDGVEEKIYAPLIEAGGMNHISIRGKGIIDLSQLPWHARKAMWIDNCSYVFIQGVTLLDCPDWGVVLNQCSNVTIHNVKEISPRENADGVDICNSQNVVVENSFIRSNDDGISVKTLSAAPAMKSLNITVQECVIWNERARALGITSETLADISNVSFVDCDIIHDLSEGGDCAALAVLVSDSGTIRNISFSDIRVEDSQTKLIRCWIGDDGWAQDSKRGHIKGVFFKNITVTGNFSTSEILGCDVLHLVENVSLSMQVNGQKITQMKDANLSTNTYTKAVRVVAN